MSEQGLSHEEVLGQRDEAVREFFAALTGAEKWTIRVLGEELQDVSIPAEAVYPTKPGAVDAHALGVAHAENVRRALCTLAGSVISGGSPEASTLSHSRRLSTLTTRTAKPRATGVWRPTTTSGFTTSWPGR